MPEKFHATLVITLERYIKEEKKVISKKGQISSERD